LTVPYLRPNPEHVLDQFHLAMRIAVLYYSNVENGLTLRRYWTTACHTCPLKSRCTPSLHRRIIRWEHEDVLETVQRRLDLNLGAMRRRREVVEHPFGTIKQRMGATHFLLKRGCRRWPARWRCMCSPTI
jgi:hypothetical protein